MRWLKALLIQKDLDIEILKKTSALLFFEHQISLSLIEELDEQHGGNNCNRALGINRVAFKHSMSTIGNVNLIGKSSRP